MNSTIKVMFEKKRTCDSKDFLTENQVSYPQFGSNTPPHCTMDFKFKDYCPMVFRNLRERFNIDAADYLRSICGDAALRSLGSPGKSGAAFFISNDDRFIIKTMSKGEMATLKELLPKYYKHVLAEKNTLLTKFFGMHRVRFSDNSVNRLVVMGNLLCTDAPIHRRFDLKGSSVGRYTAKSGDQIKPTTILKDIDIDCTFDLPPSWRSILSNQLQSDCDLLDDLGVMDYSLLIGIHFRDAKNNPDLVAGLGPDLDIDDLGDPLVAQNVKAEKMSILVGAEETSNGGTPSFNRKNRRKSLAEMGDGIAAALNHRPWTQSDRRVKRVSVAESRITSSQSDKPLTTEELAMLRGKDPELGICMVATALPHRIFPWPEEAGPKRPDLVTRPQECVIYFGIIDFLQAYNARKKVEHIGRSVQHRSRTTISAVRPTVYAKRFQGFMNQIFEKDKSGK